MAEPSWDDFQALAEEFDDFYWRIRSTRPWLTLEVLGEHLAYDAEMVLGDALGRVGAAHKLATILDLRQPEPPPRRVVVTHPRTGPVRH
jgi:hypothetical protein